MANLTGFDASQQKEMMNFDAMPAHKAQGMMVDSAMKPTKAGTGSFLECKFVLLDGPFKGSNIWTRLNLSNPTKMAEEIAQRELGAICKAVGIIKPNDSMELHNRPMMLDIDVETSDQGKVQNKLKGYAAIGAAGSVSTPIASAPAAAPAAPAVAPWLKQA